MSNGRILVTQAWARLQTVLHALTLKNVLYTSDLILRNGLIHLGLYGVSLLPDSSFLTRRNLLSKYGLNLRYSQRH